MRSLSRGQISDEQRRQARKSADMPGAQQAAVKPKPSGCACGGGCPRCQSSGRKAADGEPGVGSWLTDIGSGIADALVGVGNAVAAAAMPTKTLTIDAVKLRAASRDPASDVTFANTVFSPANVQFSLVNNATASTADSDSWLGGDTDLLTGSCGHATAEELAAWNGAATTHKFSSRMRAFYVKSIASGARGDSYSPGCAKKGNSAPLVGMISVTNSGASRTLAHELGHILLDEIGHAAATDNLMHPTNTSTGENLTDAQKAIIYANA
jgi:hypothetical protein